MVALTRGMKRLWRCEERRHRREEAEIGGRMWSQRDSGAQLSWDLRTRKITLNSMRVMKGSQWNCPNRCPNRRSPSSSSPLTHPISILFSSSSYCPPLSHLILPPPPSRLLFLALLLIALIASRYWFSSVDRSLLILFILVVMYLLLFLIPYCPPIFPHSIRHPLISLHPSSSLHPITAHLFHLAHRSYFSL